MTPRGRAYTRHREQTERARTRKRLMRRFEHHPEWLTDRVVGIESKSPHLCSGMCCGNPRKWFGMKSVQERRQNEAFRLYETAE